MLVWGAINALAPSPRRAAGALQVRLRRRLGSCEHRALWKTFVGPVPALRRPGARVLRRRVQGARRVVLGAPELAARPAALAAGKPWTADQRAWELRLSHWTGELARVERRRRLGVPRHSAHGHLRPHLLYAGRSRVRLQTDRRRRARPTPTGATSTSTRTTRCTATGWRRETSVVFRKPSGAFCYSFWPTHDVSLPGSRRDRRATDTSTASASSVPGVTPDVVAEAAGSRRGMTTRPGRRDSGDALVRRDVTRRRQVLRPRSVASMHRRPGREPAAAAPRPRPRG